MRRLIDSDLLTLLVRLFVGGTFVYASFYKIIDPGSFARSIWYYHMVDGSIINMMALILPWIELIAGLAVIFGVYYRGGVVLVNLMTLVFIAALMSAAARGIDIDCGCFKAAQASTESAMSALYFDFVLIVFTIWLWVSRSDRLQLMPVRRRRY